MRPCIISPLPLLLAAALWLGAVPMALGHGDVHQTIALLSAEIEAKPAPVRLLFERASLYANYDHWTEALSDLDRVAALEPAHELEPSLRASILRRSGKPAEARGLQEAFLQKHPHNARVRREYAQTLADLKDTAGALRELDAVIAAAQHPPPDAVALRLRLAESADPTAALEWLNGFLTNHPLPVFQEEALRMEVKLDRTDAALARMDRMIAAAPRPEFLLLRKAELLNAGGEKSAAAEAARAAQSALAKLPPHVRSTKACADLASRAAQFLPTAP
jgi:predicted Zn-dependent protease